MMFSTLALVAALASAASAQLSSCAQGCLTSSLSSSSCSSGNEVCLCMDVNYQEAVVTCISKSSCTDGAAALASFQTNTCLGAVASASTDPSSLGSLISTAAASLTFSTPYAGATPTAAASSAASAGSTGKSKSTGSAQSGGPGQAIIGSVSAVAVAAVIAALI